jgi:4-hydroxybenzoate polyprenyltransferase
MGITAGYGAVLVLALYLNSSEVVRLYAAPEFIWGAVPVMLFWVSWIWLQAHRGHMHDDPVVFALKDRASLAAGAVFFFVLALGTLDWPWL